MREVSLTEYVERQQRLRVELAAFSPERVNTRCDCCDNKSELALLDGSWLCWKCWKWEKAYLEGRACRTGMIQTAGNDRPAAALRSELLYHGTGTTETLGRKRKGEK